jgi:hypothetical protein
MNRTHYIKEENPLHPETAPNFKGRELTHWIKTLDKKSLVELVVEMVHTSPELKAELLKDRYEDGIIVPIKNMDIQSEYEYEMKTYLQKLSSKKGGNIYGKILTCLRGVYKNVSLSVRHDKPIPFKLYCTENIKDANLFTSFVTTEGNLLLEHGDDKTAVENIPDLILVEYPTHIKVYSYVGTDVVHTYCLDDNGDDCLALKTFKVEADLGVSNILVENNCECEDSLMSYKPIRHGEKNMILMKKYDGTILDLSTELVSANINNMLTTMIKGYRCLDLCNQYYTDIKFANTFYSIKDGDVSFVIGDLGSAYVDNEGEIATTYPSIDKKEQDGFLKNANGKDVSWAFGIFIVTIYTRFFYPTLYNAAYFCVNIKKMSIPEHERNVKEYVELIKNHKPPLHDQNMLATIVKEALNPDPKKRISLKKIYDLLARMFP